jgi:hypothetical protein
VETTETNPVGDVIGGRFDFYPVGNLEFFDNLFLNVCDTFDFDSR